MVDEGHIKAKVVVFLVKSQSKSESRAVLLVHGHLIVVQEHARLSEELGFSLGGRGGRVDHLQGHSDWRAAEGDGVGATAISLCTLHPHTVLRSRAGEGACEQETAVDLEVDLVTDVPHGLAQVSCRRIGSATC